MVGAISNTPQISYSGPARGTISARRERFAVSESPLREHDARSSTGASASTLADTVALSGYPAFGMDVRRPYASPPGFGFGDDRTDRENRASDGIASGEDGDKAEADKAEDGEPGRETDARGEALSEDEAKQLEQLQTRDRDVRRHEQAHKATGGSLAGSISYEYQRGPDGKNYAVGGEVSIDASRESDPAATISKMRRVRAAALAPADPSGQDRQVAAQATAQEMEAQKELSKQRMEETPGASEGTKDTQATESAETGNEMNPRDTASGPAAIARELNRNRAMIDVFA